MQLDATTVYTLAALSLLSSDIACTAPTELDEIEARADKMSEGYTVVCNDDCSYRIDITAKKWPFATEKVDFEIAQGNWAGKHPKGSADCAETYKELCKRPRYRLDRVQKLITELPF